MPVGAGGPQYHQLALIALGLGIASFLVTTCCCCFGGWSMPLSIAAAVVGFLGLQQVKGSTAYKGEAFCWVGIGGGAFGILCCLVAFLSTVDEQLLQYRHF
jgi:hypothetical protein